MNTFYIIAIFILLLIVSFVLDDLYDDVRFGSLFKKIVGGFISISLVVLSFLYGVNLGEEQGLKDGQTKALNGQFDYKMDISYKLIDSVYVPVDTTFIEVKK